MSSRSHEITDLIAMRCGLSKMASLIQLATFLIMFLQASVQFLVSDSNDRAVAVVRRMCILGLSVICRPRLVFLHASDGGLDKVTPPNTLWLGVFPHRFETD